MKKYKFDEDKLRIIILALIELRGSVNARGKIYRSSVGIDG